MLKKYSTLAVSQSVRKKFESLKWDVRKRTNDEVLLSLMDIKNILFNLRKGENSTKQVSGLLLYDNLLNGWEIAGYDFKK